MQTLNRYLSRDFISTFGMTLSVITFVMCIGSIFRAIDVSAKGISALLVAKVFFLNLPFMLTFSIPISVMTSVLLLFGRLSFDGELSAMKACGLSMGQIIAPVIVLSIVLSGLCLYINIELAPRCVHAMRGVVNELSSEDPSKLIEAGRFIRDFPGLLIRVEKRKGNRIEDVVVYKMDDKGDRQNVRAKWGTLRTDRTNRVLVIDLYDARIDHRTRDPETGEDKQQYMNASHVPYTYDLKTFVRQKSTRKKNPDMTLSEIMVGIRDIKLLYPELEFKDLMKQRMGMAVEANKRLALSLSCFAFALLAIPLGLRSKRKESSLGMGISLMCLFVFYLFIIVANSLTSNPELRPDLIVWIPVVMAEVGGFWMIWKTN